MNDKHEILSLFPDHINGKLAEHDKLIVDEALRSFPELKAEYDEYVQVFHSLNKTDILSTMEAKADTFALKSMNPKMMRPMQIMIGSVTTLAACLLVWIGITSTDHVSSIEKSPATVGHIEVESVSYADNLNGTNISTDDLEDIMLEEVLALYVRDIESDLDAPLNPVLEEEITKYLLKESQDEESM